MNIKLWNRQTQCYEYEVIYSEGPMKWLYTNFWGRFFEKYIVSKKLFAKLYGLTKNTRLSRGEIPKFVKTFAINLDDFEEEDYKSFNHFFSRCFKNGKRAFVQGNDLPSWGEGRLIVKTHLESNTLFEAKGQIIRLEDLVQNKRLANKFNGGSAAILRLAPADYHHFHYFDHGKTLKQEHINGSLHSVNPISSQIKKDVYLNNERYVSELHTKTFGSCLYVEIGGLCVGRIKHSHTENSFKRGDAKGYFLFGGSTVIVIFQQEVIDWEPDLVRESELGIESIVKLGEKIGHRSC